jgi:dolichyl-phosphate beta-glucosyltransferase
VVIPAFNEAQRLPPYLASIRGYLRKWFADDHEVIVVDDGSSDGTAEVVKSLGSDWPQLRVISLSENQGKGAAVRAGMLAARGEVLLFADADGATPIEEERRLRAAIDAGADVAVGSRLLAARGVIRRRKWTRAITGRLFACAARRIVPVSVRDTQCGFKMFRRAAGKRLLAASQERGYLLDLELLLLADRFGYWVAEAPVNWSEQPGSKLNLARQWKTIAAGLWRLRRRLQRVKRTP